MRTSLKFGLSALIVVAAAYNVYASFHTWFMPFEFDVADRHTLVVGPAPGVPLPTPILAGDRLDPAAQDFETRSALDVAYNGRTLPWDKAYTLHLIHASGPSAGKAYDATVTTVMLPPTPKLRTVQASLALIMVLFGLISLLLLWRGRDRAAAALAAWNGAFVVGVAFNYMPIDGVLGVAMLQVSLIFFLIGRAAFYLMADSLVAPLLGIPFKLFFHMVFGLVFLLGAAQSMGSALLFAWNGYVEFSLPSYSLFFSWVFIVPVVFLLVGYARAGAGLKVKLGWVAFAGVLLMASVTITNAQPFGYIGSYAVSSVLFTIMALSFAYALLRLRIVSLAIVFDRALVYGLVTTLVVGVIAAVNSVVLRETLPPGAGLALQVVVPLALGIVLGRVREYLDRVVERVFFRAKYLSEKALRNFSRRAGHFEDTVSLLDGAATELRRHTGAPAVAVYSVENRECKRLKQSGGTGFPAELRTDDAILVALRAEHRAVDLDALASELGEDGCAFPMLVLGTLRGVIVLKNRPGEHYGADEKKLLTHVAREVGAAWRILRARENEALVLALADGELKTLKAARDKARALTAAWAGV
ncbi:MAG: GAF domain-containing protein [Bacillota bacterium]